MAEKYIPFIILTSVFTIFNLFVLIKKMLFLKHAISTVGIVKKSGEGSLSSGTEGTYFQTVEFQTEQGKVITRRILQWEVAVIKKPKVRL